MGGGAEEEQRRLEQFRSWHDEAFLYINQAVTQEADNIGRPDVALLMYQRGLGLVDLYQEQHQRPIHQWQQP